MPTGSGRECVLPAGWEARVAGEPVALPRALELKITHYWVLRRAKSRETFVPR